MCIRDRVGSEQLKCQVFHNLKNVTETNTMHGRTICVHCSSLCEKMEGLTLETKSKATATKAGTKAVPRSLGDDNNVNPEVTPKISTPLPPPPKQAASRRKSSTLKICRSCGMDPPDHIGSKCPSKTSWCSTCREKFNPVTERYHFDHQHVVN